MNGWLTALLIVAAIPNLAVVCLVVLGLTHDRREIRRLTRHVRRHAATNRRSAP